MRCPLDVVQSMVSTIALRVIERLIGLPDTFAQDTLDAIIEWESEFLS